MEGGERGAQITELKKAFQNKLLCNADESDFKFDRRKKSNLCQYKLEGGGGGGGSHNRMYFFVYR